MLILMKLYLARHAQSEANLGSHTGKETVLTKTGIEQAKRLGIYFKNKNIDKVYCSKLIRAKDTLKEIIPYIEGVPITYTIKLNERYKGIYENKLNDFNKALRKSGLASHEYRPPKGENIPDLEKRALQFIKFLKKNHKNENILIVSHSEFLRILIVKIFSYSLLEGKYFNLNNAGVSSFNFDEKWNIKNFEIDNSKHLLLHSSYQR